MSSRVIQGCFQNGKPRVPRNGAAVQAKGVNQTIPLDASRLNLSASTGRPLPEAVQQKMESFFGSDFSDVRIHVGTQAPSIGALAFTMGSNIYFAPGQYNPNSQGGQQLLGHELAHVVQQRAGRVKNPQGGIAIVQDHALEAEADRLGARAAIHRVQAKMASLGQAASVPHTTAIAQAKPSGYKLVIGSYLHQGPAAASLPPDLAGHAFVSIQGPGKQETWGFSPANYSRYDPKKDIAQLRTGVPGIVHRDDAAFRKPGVKLRSYSVSAEQAQAALAKVSEYKTRHYTFNAQSRQCTTFAKDVLGAAKIQDFAGAGIRPAEIYWKV